MIELKYTGQTIHEVLSAVKATVSELAQKEEAKVSGEEEMAPAPAHIQRAAKESKRGRGRPKKEEAVELSQTNEATGEEGSMAIDLPVEKAPEPAIALTLEYIQNRAATLGTLKGRDALVAVLGEFGVSKASELSESVYAEFVEFVEKALA